MSYDVTKLRVLIVDDNPHLRRLLWTILNSLEIKAVTEADEGGQGLMELRNSKPNIVFIDWEMSPMNGVEMVQRIRQMDNDLHRFVPIIMMSGHPELHRILEARDAGATEFLAKPLSTRAVFDRLVAVIEKPRDFVRTKGFFGPDRRRRTWEAYTGAERRDGGNETEVAVMAADGLESNDLVLRPVAEQVQNRVGGGRK